MDPRQLMKLAAQLNTQPTKKTEEPRRPRTRTKVAWSEWKPGHITAAVADAEPESDRLFPPCLGKG